MSQAGADGRRGSLKSQIELLFAGRMAEKLISFVALVVMARLMTPADLALLPSFYITGSAVVILAGLGGMPVLMIELPRLAASDEVKAATLVRTVLFCFAVASGLGVGVLLAFPAATSWAGRVGLSGAEAWALVLGAILQGAFSLVSQALAALGRFRKLIAVDVFLAVLRLTAISAYLVQGRMGLLAALGVSAAAGLAVALWNIRDLLLRSGPRWDHRSFLGMSWPLYLEGYLMFFRRQGDQVVVAALLGAKALAGYYLARRLVNMLKTVAESFDSVVAPAMSRLSLSTANEFAHTWHRYFGLSLSATMPVAVGAALVAPAYLAIVGGREYEAFAVAASVLCLSFAVDIVKGSIISRAVFVLYPSWVRLFLTTVETVVLLPLLAAGAWMAGATGAAIGVVIAGVVAGLCGLLVLGRRIEVRVVDGAAIAAVVQSFGAALIALIVCCTLQRFPLGRFEVEQTIVALAGALTFVVAYANILSRSGVQMLTEALRGTRAAPVVRIVEFLRLRRDRTDDE